MQSFSSSGKIKVREDDLSLIAELSRKANRKLTYLGLPSPWMGDISSWKPYLSQIFAVEREKLYLSHLMDKAYVLELFDRVVYLYGNIDKICERKIDDFGKSIDAIFPVDLINLDYCEGLDYLSFIKLTTLESLIRMQKEALISKHLSRSFPYFILLLTHNIPSHEGNPTDKLKYLKFLIREVDLFGEDLREKVQKSFDWYNSDECPSAYQHKCFVMGKIFEYAQANGFKAIPQKIIQYLGDKNAVMMHYQFQITPVNLQSMVPFYNKFSPIDIMDFQVMDENGNNIISHFPNIR